jgi:hypothetical protein
MQRSLVLAGVSTLVMATYGLTAASKPQSVRTRQSTTATVQDQRECPVTAPNGLTPPGERRSPSHHGNGALWTQLWPNGTVVFRPGGPGFVLTDGSLQMKFPWWRGVPGSLRIDGRRVDAPAPPLRARIPSGYSGSFQATGLVFPTPGCWEVTGRVGEASLTFVVVVVKIGGGPVQNGLPQVAAQQRMHPAALRDL